MVMWPGLVEAAITNYHKQVAKSLPSCLTLQPYGP